MLVALDGDNGPIVGSADLLFAEGDDADGVHLVIAASRPL